MKKHPSGRPIRKEEKKGPIYWRIPNDGPVIPRLRIEQKTQAIGFVLSFNKEDEDK